MRPKVLVLKADGINCDEELAFAFNLAGGVSEIVHINELRSKKKSLSDFQILAIPGGFSYGDDIVSGKILAVELSAFLAKELKKFVKRQDTLVIGICNGFQVLVRTGLLPFANLGKMDATLTNNDSGHFECRWINLNTNKGNRCVFLNGLNGVLSFQVAHGEGKFFASPKILSKIEKEKLVVFRYCDEKGNPTQKYPDNPNGSLNAIAGICDPTGRILGLMPHPERFVRPTQHPNWRRLPNLEPQGLRLFEKMVAFATQMWHISSRPREEGPITYASTGVDYSAMDPLKRLAQLKARETSVNLNRFGMREVERSRGESAYVWEEEDSYRAKVIEDLGTKNLVADEVRKFTGKTHYDSLAQDTVAMIVNDLIVVGAQPQVVDAYWAVGNSDWFKDEERAKDLVKGWANACNIAGAAWGGGETPTLKGIIEPDTIDLAGSAIGIIKPKERLTLGDKLSAGDAILLIESSGIHANGLTLARTIGSRLPDGYATKLSDGKTYGESLLTPTHIYAGLVRALFEAGIDIHYMVNITGHGWRKLMRADRELTYEIDKVPKPHPIFKFIQEQSRNSDAEMYGNFNMGAGFAVLLPEDQTKYAKEVAINFGFGALIAGRVKEGKKQVVIKPKNIVYKAQTLGVR